MSLADDHSSGSVAARDAPVRREEKRRIWQQRRLEKGRSMLAVEAEVP